MTPDPEQLRTTTVERAVRAMRRILKGLSIGMLTTSSTNGQTHNRPMLLQEIDALGHVWLMTDNGSDKTLDIATNPKVNLAFVSRRQDRVVSLCGDATLRHDPDKLRQLWKASYRAWYPQGKSDPRLVLLEIDVADIEYWTAPTSRIVRLLRALKAVMTRRPIQSGEHRTISVRP